MIAVRIPDMYQFNQIFVNIFSAILVLITLFSLGRPSFRPKKHATPDMMIFTYFCLSVFMILVLEASRWYAYAFPSRVGRPLHSFIFFLYYALQYIPASLYLLYVDYHLHEKTERLRTMARILVPINVTTILASASAPWTGLLYRITEENRYERGTGLYVFLFLLFLFMIAGFCLAVRGRRKQNVQTVRNLLIFPMITITAGIIQVLFYGVTIAWPSSVVFIIVAAMNIQKLQIHTDHLTGLLNRRSFDDRLSSEVDRSERYSSPLSLILMDIDHFKQINDDYGHDIGDQILIQISDILSTHTRSTDTVARWGGEEFIILMPETDQSDAAYAAEKLRKEIAEFTFVNSLQITMSFGVAQWLKVVSKNIWFKRADRALYHAKENGRNRVEQCLWRSIISPEETSIRWQSRYETGDAELDEEHRELIRIASRLFKEPESEEELRKAKMDLKHHIDMHFSHEEKLMEEYSYPQKSAHTKIHRDLVDQAVTAFSEVDQGFFDNFYFFLIDEVIVKHFFRSDKPFVEYMQAQGVR